MPTGCAFTCPTPPGGGGNFSCDPKEPEEACSDNEKCMPWANDGGQVWNATRCSPVSPSPTQLGEACTVEGSAFSGVDDCDVGLKCWRVDPDTDIGVCNQFCSAVDGSPTCPAGTICSEPYGAVLPICVDQCDPLGEDCGQAEGCYPAGLTFGCLPTLEPAQSDGGECEFRTHCLSKSTCLPADDLDACAGDSCCTRFCDLNEPECADCTQLFENPALPKIGYCPSTAAQQ